MTIKTDQYRNRFIAFVCIYMASQVFLKLSKPANTMALYSLYIFMGVCVACFIYYGVMYYKTNKKKND